jgi:Retinal pigment epithelial membrane protein/SnoaL-like domain
MHQGPGLGAVASAAAQAVPTCASRTAVAAPRMWFIIWSRRYYKRRALAVGVEAMAADFRGHPMFPSTGFNAPTRFEADIHDCEVWGKVPSDIEGKFYRMQCDFQYRPPQNERPTGFNGDGHISRFWFKDSNVNYRGRYVKTARLEAERKAHRRLYGVYKGPRLREFLVKVFGRGQKGPVEGRLGNHLNLQPVITVAADGTTAKVRARMLQQMSMGARASMGGAIYKNELVKEDGVWKFSKVHAYNTFTAGYIGGWARAASSGMPGPAADFPPDSPPTAKIAMLPVVYEIPYHYANPVTGRTELAPPGNNRE